MEKRAIGSLSVSLVGLGCNNFGWRLDYDASTAVIDAAIDAGINFFDTADIYGKTASEEFMGRALSGKRDRILIATKFGMKVDEQRNGARPEYVRQACEDSLRRLNTSHIDLYQLHQPDPEVPIEETLGALRDLVHAGKVREIGASNFSAEHLRAAEAVAESLNQKVSPGRKTFLAANGEVRSDSGTSASPAVPAGSRASAGTVRFVSLQNEYSLFHRDPENGVLQECQRLGVAFLPYFPLASGLLTGKYRKGRPLPPNTRLTSSDRFGKLLSERNISIVESLIRFAESRGHTLLELAFSWLAAQPTVASVIAGATSPEQVRSNATAVNWNLSPADLAEIDKILAQPA
jgi:aryl-alcohol dehydrogenase-like predicted oxidoreductase